MKTSKVNSNFKRLRQLTVNFLVYLHGDYKYVSEYELYNDTLELLGVCDDFPNLRIESFAILN